MEIIHFTNLSRNPRLRSMSSLIASVSSLSLQRSLLSLQHLFKVVLQVVVLSCIWLSMDVLRQHFGWSMPAGLFSGVIKVQWLKGGTNWLLAEMLLFFVPAVLVVTEYPELIQNQGLRILAVIISSTLCVMMATAWAVDRVYRLELLLARRRSSRGA